MHIVFHESQLLRINAQRYLFVGSKGHQRSLFHIRAKVNGKQFFETLRCCGYCNTLKKGNLSH